MARRRRTCTSEFKVEAVNFVTQKGYSVAEACRSLDICESLLRSWMAAIQEKGPDAFPGHGRLGPQEEEIRRLRAENQRLLAEREIRQIAAAFIARRAQANCLLSRSLAVTGRNGSIRCGTSYASYSSSVLPSST